MKFVFKYSLVFIMLVFVPRCGILENNESNISPLDTKINFKVIESYETYETIAPPSIYIELISEKIYRCFNYVIANNHLVGDKTIEIDILGIEKPGTCPTALGPAKSRIKLGKISGIYEIIIKGNEFIDSYNLLISDSLIIVDGRETSNTKPLTSFLHKFPQNSFAYLCGTTLSDTFICDSFIDTLKSVINLTEFSFSDFAKIPYQTASQGHQYDADARYFYYKNEEDFERIQEVMKSFKHDYFPTDNGVGLSIISWMNKKYYSWVL